MISLNYKPPRTDMTDIGLSKPPRADMTDIGLTYSKVNVAFAAGHDQERADSLQFTLCHRLAAEAV